MLKSKRRDFMRIIDCNPADEPIVNQVASILFESFKEIWPEICPDLESALAEVHRCCVPGHINRIAVAEDGTVLGWIGGVSEYHGNAWCLYPLAVHPAYRAQGIGRALVLDLERLVREQGGITIFLGTDDTAGMTSLGNTDLYPHVLEHLANARNLRRHPFEFYQKLGYRIVGVIPDANGPGKPDILMAKRVAG
jgi:aminoglycoside 6'-N-acetyltransferase I